MDRLRAATTGAHECARAVVEEHLPERFRYRVKLNSSYDGNPRLGDETVCPEDGTPERAAATANLGFDEVVDLLWRDGSVPEWINIRVADVTEGETIVGLDACGRFTAMDGLLYHHWQGCPPFEVQTPFFPASAALRAARTGSEPGSEPRVARRFSIHHDPVCRRREDLTRLGFFSDKVESLELHGPGITEEMLDLVPVLPALRVLCLREFSINGPGLAAIGKQAGLIRLSVSFRDGPMCDLSRFPVLPQLTDLELQHLPVRVVGLARLVSCCPSLERLSVDSRFMPEMETPMPAFPSGLPWLSLAFPQLPEAITSCATDVLWLSLRLQEPDDERVIALAGRLPSLANLMLDGSPVTDRIFEAAKAWPNLASLNVVNTAVTVTGLLRFMGERPGVAVSPRIGDRDGLAWYLRHEGLLGADEDPERLPEWGEWVRLLDARQPGPAAP